MSLLSAGSSLQLPRFCALPVLALLLSSAELRGEGTALPEFVNWSYDGAWQRDNALRSEIVLNGWWRWQPEDRSLMDLPRGPSIGEMLDTDEEEADDEEEKEPEQKPADDGPPRDGWMYRKVPGAGSPFQILTAERKSAVTHMGRKLRTSVEGGRCWVEREFTVPAGWKGKDVQIVFENVWGAGEVFLDGKKLGHTWSMRWHHIDLPRPYKLGQPYRLSVKCSGIVSNVWLKACGRTGGRILDSYLMTSVQKMAATIRASGKGQAAAAARVIITDYGKPDRIVKTAGPFQVDRQDDAWRVEQSFDWKDAELWSLSRPNLYQYSLELLDAEGKALDRIFPIRFGFREVWIQGGTFMLNNRRITLTMDIHTPLATKSGWGGNWNGAGKMASDDVWRKAVHRWKKLGINTAIHRWSANVDDQTVFRVADEEGFFICLDTYGLQYGNPEANKIPAIQEHKRDLNRYLILPRRHCPSVAFYYLAGTSNTWDYEPTKLGEDYDTEKLFGRHNHPGREFVHSLDPTRVAFAVSGGGKQEPVHSSMNYIHIDADLQVHETWPSHWYKKKNRPLATYEMAAPPYIADWYTRRSRGEQAHGTKGVLPHWLEVAAIYLGETPYQTEPRDNIKTWLERAGTTQSQIGLKWRIKCYEEVAKLFTRNVYRAWRTYGVNMGFFTQVRGYTRGKPFIVEPLDVDPRRPGLFADVRAYLADPFTEEPYTPVGEVARQALSPLLMYLGGPDGEFARKDRAWYRGETVRKAVVILNDRDNPATVSGKWELCDSQGQAALSGNLPQTKLTPGELAPARVHLEFQAPEAEVRTEYSLKLHGAADAEGSLEDELKIAVFPRPPAPHVPQGINLFLYDPIGETKGLLTEAEAKFAMVGGTLPDPENSLLIIGRNALKDEENRKGLGALLYRKMGYDFGINVSNGMRVLVFEQALDNLWGMTTEQTRWRRTFITAPGHPVFKGLGKGDFIYLRGDSDLVEPYPPAPPGRGSSRVATDRFSEWGNDNVVTTYALTRPQLGAMRALIACGFDLQETPLLEAVGGRGRLMFCQVDVTNRYGTDPVSTQLVNNLLTYMTTASPPDTGIGKPTDLVREGWEDYDLTVKEEKGAFIFDRPEGPLSWGITAAETYFEGLLNIPVIQGEDGQRYLYSRLPGEKTVAHTLNRRKFKTRWQKMKALTVRSALQINQGGSSETFPGPGLQGDAEALYPMDWLEGFVHPYLMMQW